MGDLDWAGVNIFLLVGKRDSACCESDEAKDDEEYSDDGCGFHGEPFLCGEGRVIKMVDAGFSTDGCIGACVRGDLH